jgi:methyl-accepting chemotaxis protein
MSSTSARARTLSIRTKLLLQAAGVLVGVCVLGVGAYYTIERVKVTGPLYASIIRDKDLLADTLPPPAYILETYLVANQLVSTRDAKQVETLLAKSETLLNDYNTRRDYWREELPEGQMKDRLLGASDEAVRAFFATFSGEFQTAVKAGDRERALTILNSKLTPSYELHRAEIDQIVKLATASSQATESETAAALTMSNYLVVGLSVGVALLSTLGCIMVGRSITRRLPALLGFADALARGDMSGRLNFNTTDEFGKLGRSFDQAAESMCSVVSEVSGNASEVAGAATQIAAAAEQMSASVGEVARQSAQASDSASRSGEMAVSGGEVVGKTVVEMKQIASAVNSTATSIKSLGERGEQIGRVIAVINDIADQTNLLALNAAIEAARAGEHGRGFAVVADEVRKLAERTTKATEEVASSIKAIQDETKTAVERMSQGTRQVGEGVELAETAGGNLQQIVASANEVSQLISSISAASAEAGAATSQSAQAAQELSSKAERLRELMSQFRTVPESAAAGRAGDSSKAARKARK